MTDAVPMREQITMPRNATEAAVDRLMNPDESPLAYYWPDQPLVDLRTLIVSLTMLFPQHIDNMEIIWGLKKGNSNGPVAPSDTTIKFEGDEEEKKGCMALVAPGAPGAGFITLMKGEYHEDVKDVVESFQEAVERAMAVRLDVDNDGQQRHGLPDRYGYGGYHK